jgi:hypothetical protein
VFPNAFCEQIAPFLHHRTNDAPSAGP